MRIVMIGHGMVGHRFLENLAKKATVPHEVIVLAEEPRPAYDRVQFDPSQKIRQLYPLKVVDAFA